MEWTPHWLEAEGSLQPWREQIGSEIEATHTIVSGFVSPPRLDILLQRLPGRVIPELGIGGHSFGRSLLSLTFDPENPNFSSCLVDGTLRRTVAHEVHHCLRNAARGVGRTLGDALVSEGLAGQFVKRLFASSPEPWERAVDPAVLPSLLPDESVLSSTEYDHDAWFYGVGGRFPRWLGYTLGYTVVGHWLEVTPDVDGDKFIHVSVAEVLSAWQHSG